MSASLLKLLPQGLSFAQVFYSDEKFVSKNIRKKVLTIKQIGI
jgi:hypothetical protein